MPDRQRALIFDYDGVIVDSEDRAARAVCRYLAGRGVSIGLPDLSEFFGSTDPNVYRAWREALSGWLGAAHDLDAINGDIEDLIATVKREAQVLSGVRELIDEARRAGWGIGLATGAQRNRLERELEARGLRTRFDAVVTADQVARGKPQPDIFLRAAQELAVDPQRCVVVEDSLHGTLAALAAGMRVILCPCEVTSHCNFPQGPYRVGSLLEVSLSHLEDDDLGRSGVTIADAAQQ